jgi:hypothetical protein
MFKNWIAWILNDFILAMLIATVVLIFIHVIIRFRKVPFSEIAYRWVALFLVGFVGIYTFVMHVFYPQIASATIGWAASPFQFEVGVADLALGVLGICSFRASYSFRIATVLTAMIMLWGDAIGHIYQMMYAHNFTSGNAGNWFILDVMVPLILLLCLSQIRPSASR